MIKQIAALHSFRGWLLTFGLLFAAIVLIPILNVFVSEESFLHVPDYMFPLLGKYLCYAMVALAVDLIWGYTGILSLGHGVFFSMGGYAVYVWSSYGISLIVLFLNIYLAIKNERKTLNDIKKRLQNNKQ